MQGHAPYLRSGQSPRAVIDSDRYPRLIVILYRRMVVLIRDDVIAQASRFIV